MTWKRKAIDSIVWGLSSFHKAGISPVQEEPDTILVMRSSDFGDLLVGTPIFEALRRRYPKARLIGGVGSWARPILENNPFVDDILELDVPWNNKFVPESIPAVWKFIMKSPNVQAARKSGGFDLGIDLLGSHFGSALMMRLGVRYMVGIRDYRAGWRACQAHSEFSTRQSVSQAALEQARLVGAVDLPEARPQLFSTATERREACRIWGLPRSAREVKLLVGAGGGLVAKCWPAEPAAAALLRLTELLKPRGITLNILLLGGPADRERSAAILAAGPPGSRSACGETSLRVSFALAEQADLVLTNSSMLLHAAAAFRKPVVTVLGPMHFRTDDHDLLWGYPAPYVSAGPTPEGGWPPVEEVAQKLYERVPGIAA